MAPSIARNDTVGRADLLDFVRTRHRVILVTRRRDGSAQLSPVSAGIDEDGRLVVSTYPERAKVRNLRRDPRAGAMVLSDEWNGPWVQVDGTAEVIDLPDALEPLEAYYRSIAGEHPDWAEYREAIGPQRSIVRRTRHLPWRPIASRYSAQSGCSPTIER